ncbi:hypothetical protein CLAVI_000915 [Candidatus Clavichlamydia salmonicola]|uniref:hypothetical protein n=1 Tax=Candidatus Clavichlamydia salmonicola TaxID=469812 RepID=UPI0018919265|nr:hypothetical protein [Candidatus Clavichlamydia salmonicola]MBF5051274.1 hypothetical protein [Candidatus Clavichlamydia salmonicola]
MPYFTLKYLDDVVPSSTFIIIEETASLTLEKIETISNLAYSAISNHATCSSVPASFPLDARSHYNTLILLEEVLLTLVHQSKETVEHNLFLQNTLSYLYSILWTNVGTSFQQPLPTLNISEDSLSNNHAGLKRALSSSSMSPTSKKYKETDTGQQRSIDCSPILTSLDTIHNPLTPTETPPLYLLPFLEVLPRTNTFIVIQKPVVDLENYFCLLHAELNAILEAKICLLKDSSSEKVTKSQTDLCNETFQALLPLLQQQTKLLQLIPDPEKHQAYLDEHLYLIQEVTIRLQAAGFSDTAISSMMNQEAPLIQQNQPNPNPFPDSRALSNPVQQRTEKKTPLSEKSPTKTPETYLIPLCYLTSVKTMSGHSSIPQKSTYTLSYQVKKSIRSISQCYSNCRATFFLLLESTKELLEDSPDIIYKTRYACPFKKTTSDIDKMDMVKLLFLGLKNNLAFLKQHHPKLLETTTTFTPLSDLETALQLAKNYLQTDLPLEEAPDILSMILIEAQQNPLFKPSPIQATRLAPITTTLVPTEIQDQETTLSLKNYIQYSRKLRMMPVFSCSKKISTSNNQSKKSILYILYYQLRINHRSTSHLYTHLRHTIKILSTSVESLLSPHFRSELKINFRSIPPFQTQSQVITPEEALTQLFYGLKENLSFFKEYSPKLLNPTEKNNPLKDLTMALKLVKKELKDNMPPPKTPTILSQLLQKGLLSQPKDNEET